MSLFGQTKRHTPTSKPRRSPLPVFASNAEMEKFTLSTSAHPARGWSSWFTIIPVALPSFRRNDPKAAYPSHRPRRHVNLCLPIPPRLYTRTRFLLLLACILCSGIFLLGLKKNRDGRNTWSPPFVDPDTTVLTPEEIGKIWEWEVLSGHHPSIQEGV
jgi:WD repeat and SOF domain-containing protein 1